MSEAEPSAGARRGLLGAEDRRRIIFSCLSLAAKSSLRADLSLGDLTQLMELAYFQQARRSGLKMRQITDLFGVGMTKAAELSKDLKAHFLAPEREHGIARQLLSLLWSEPLTFKRIGRELPRFTDEELQAALDQLMAEQRVRRVKGRTERFAPSKVVHRLSVLPWMARVDGLDTLMDHVFEAIEARFDKDDGRAHVRNIAFRARPEGLSELRRHYEEVLIPLIVRLDDDAEREGEGIPIKFSVLWTPTADTEEA